MRSFDDILNKKNVNKLRKGAVHNFYNGSYQDLFEQYNVRLQEQQEKRSQRNNSGHSNNNNNQNQQQNQYQDHSENSYSDNNNHYEQNSEPTIQDFFVILGFSAEPEEFSEVKKRYKSMVKYLHPDQPSGNQEDFIKVNQAYEEAKEYYNDKEGNS